MELDWGGSHCVLLHYESIFLTPLETIFKLVTHFDGAPSHIPKKYQVSSRCYVEG